MADDDSSASEEISESCYSEEEDEEPKLKYERLGEDLNDIFKKDSASCICITEKLIVLGTNWGRLHILDHQGNKVRMFQLFSSPVTMLSMDSIGDYVACASNDKKIMIQGLFSNDFKQSVDVDFPIRSLALDPSYGKVRANRRFVVGDHRVTLYEKTRMFGSLKETILYEGTRSTGELVRTLVWHEEFLSWASDTSIKIMHLESREIVSLIKRDHSLALGCDQYPAHICWVDDTTLLIGWGDSVKVCRIRKRTYEESVSAGVGLPPYIVEIVYMFSTDFYVCGVGPLDGNVVVLAYGKGFNEDLNEKVNRYGNEWRRPQLRLVKPLQGTCEEISKDVLAIRSYQDNQPNHYHLAYLNDERRFYIVCPRDFVIAKPREPHDRVQWLLQHQKFQEALEVVEDNGGKAAQFTSLSIGNLYIDHLLANRKYLIAAQVSADIFKSDRTAWEEMVKRFINLGEISILTPYIPIGGSSLTLSHNVYQSVLTDLLSNDHQGFLEAIKIWPKTFYDIPDLINRILGILTKNATNNALLRALAHLYSNAQKHDKALAIYLKLQDADIFELLEKHRLWDCVAKHIIELMKLDSKQALAICSAHASTIHPEDIMQALSKEEEYLYQYLNMLYESHCELSVPYHNVLLALYAKFNRSNILSLLRASPSIDLKPALKITRQYKLSQETVYLLVRMGNTEAALKHLLVLENDIHGAIQICKEHSDPDLWVMLINHSLKNPDQIRELLNHIGAHVDPLLILRRIPRNMKIPGLRNALTKILHDCQLKISLQSGYQRILVADNMKLIQKKHGLVNAGLAVRGEAECPICSKSVCSRTEREDVTVFGCRHIYHTNCLNPQSENCPVCQSSRKLIPSVS